MPNQNDRRRREDVRWYCRVSATVDFTAEAPAVLAGRCLNLSQSGLGLRLFGAPPPGAHARVVLHLPGGSGVACHGRIAWVQSDHPPGTWLTGVAFAEPLDETIIMALTANGAPTRPDPKRPQA
jgi:hypothetical protein